jgi:hypothetical protein
LESKDEEHQTMHKKRKGEFLIKESENQVTIPEDNISDGSDSEHSCSEDQPVYGLSSKVTLIVN